MTASGSFVLFDDEGVIHRVISFDTGGLHAIPGSANDALERVDMETLMIVPKLEMHPQISVDQGVVKLEGLPAGAKVKLGAIAVSAPSGVAHIPSPGAGEHLLRIEAKHYMQHREVVHVP